MEAQRWTSNFETVYSQAKFSASNGAYVPSTISERSSSKIAVCAAAVLATLIAFVITAPPASAQDSKYVGRYDDGFEEVPDQIPGPACVNVSSRSEGAVTPCSDTEHAAWLADLRHWRMERLIRIGYNGSRYEIPELRWTQSSFVQPQMMVEDRYFYDPVAGKYTVDRYLDDLQKRYGGIDSILIWPTYPNMGIDNRNQHDMICAMPGGVAGVKQMIADFHKRGVRVLFPMMMWDQGTRDNGKPWPDAIAELMAEVGADGINGDTQDGVPLAFFEASEKVHHPLVFEPEGGPADEAVAYDLMTWGQYPIPRFAPRVDRYKWLEPRHMVNVTDRWNRDHTGDLQYAFFNGVGFETWENIWAIWNGITPRDAEATRRVATMERALAPFLVSSDWEPFAQMLRFGVFASRWPLGDQSVWTIVNRNEYDVAGAQMELPAVDGMRYFDLYHGVELQPTRDGDRVRLNFAIGAKDYGSILATKSASDAKITALMAQMKTMTAKPLTDFSHEWKAVPQHLVEIAATKPSASAPADMVKIPAGTFNFRVHGIEMEGSNDVGLDVQMPWEDSARRYHEHVLEMKSFWIDKYPVTNAEFKKFVDAAHYHPKDDLNFLRDWHDGMFPEGAGDKPVTYVSLEDARAYAAWAGKRLPHDWEWQYAAQGNDGRMYPWGNEWNAAAVPTPDKSRTMRGADSVSAHAAGASPFGVMDLVGNVWQWTDEYIDEHSRGGILRGGSYYQPQGSKWYFPQAYKLDEHGKLLLMAPSKDRSGALGFRCVRDAE
jgi:gamma-glutamyl hercynylcysteine S-oxide synthase